MYIFWRRPSVALKAIAGRKIVKVQVTCRVMSQLGEWMPRFIQRQTVDC